MNPQSKVYVAGHSGLAGSAIWRELVRLGFKNIVGLRSSQLDLRSKSAVDQFFEKERPEYVFLAAGHVGGIQANSEKPVDFILFNLLIQTNVINACFKFNCKKLLFLGSSCVYPKYAPQPLRENYLMSGPLEPSNEWYAVAKIAGIELCQAYRKQYNCDFICAMPTNLYGPNDNYDLDKSHVFASLIRRFHEAKISKKNSVTCWGTGKPLREFMHSDDLGNAAVFLMKNYSAESIINVGSGSEISIRQLSELISSVVGYHGSIEWDLSKPDGTPRKLLDCSKINNLGWRPSINLESGVRLVYSDFIKNECAYAKLVTAQNLDMLI